MNESQADKIIELLERIADSQDQLLREQRESDAKMEEEMRKAFGGDDEEKKSTERDWQVKKRNLSPSTETLPRVASHCTALDSRAAM